MRRRGWQELDVLLVTGDAYVDHSSYGAAVIGRLLEAEGFKVGIIAQPGWRSAEDFSRLGRPRLFAGVTAGNLDSMVAHYSAGKVRRKQDEYSPGGAAGRRPDRAAIVYANRVREAFPGLPVVIGGIEASMRRLAHYDYWDDKVRRSILLDAKADILVYGMGETPIIQIARRLAEGAHVKEITGVRGTVVARSSLDGLGETAPLPSFEEVSRSADEYNRAATIFAAEQNPVRGRTLVQRHGDRFVIQFPPALPLDGRELDRIYLLGYTRAPHPAYDAEGGIPGFETVRCAVVSHRGCPGGCTFCSLSAHQGAVIQSRSIGSVLEEIGEITQQGYFKGTITDIGGPTANLYGAECPLWKRSGPCARTSCLAPGKCGKFVLGYERLRELLREARAVPGVRHVFISSGVRCDLMADREADGLLRDLAEHHVSGRLKVAPEHNCDGVLALMNKPPFAAYERFAEKYAAVNAGLGKRQYLVRYFLSAHPGCTLKDALELALYLAHRRIHPEQIQDFIPLPLTIAAAMYYTEKNPFTGGRIPVAKTPRERTLQRALIQHAQPANRKLVIEALGRLGRRDLMRLLARRRAARPAGGQARRRTDAEGRSEGIFE